MSGTPTTDAHAVRHREGLPPLHLASCWCWRMDGGPWRMPWVEYLGRALDGTLPADTPAPRPVERRSWFERLWGWA